MVSRSAFACCQSDARLQAPEHGKARVIAAPEHALLFPEVGQRNPDLGQARETQIIRQDADDFTRDAIHHDLLTENVGRSRRTSISTAAR